MKRSCLPLIQFLLVVKQVVCKLQSTHLLQRVRLQRYICRRHQCQGIPSLRAIEAYYGVDLPLFNTESNA